MRFSTRSRLERNNEINEGLFNASGCYREHIRNYSGARVLNGNCVIHLLFFLYGHEAGNRRAMIDACALRDHGRSHGGFTMELEGGIVWSRIPCDILNCVVRCLSESIRVFALTWNA